MTLEARGYEVIMSVSIDINKVVKKYGDTVVVNGLSDDISLVDTKTNKVLRSVPVGRVPHTAVIDD